MSLSRVLLEGPGHSFGPVYHGGSWDGRKPIRVTGRGALGVGAYFTPIESKSDQYAKEASGQTVAAYLDINKPLVIHASQHEHPCVQALVTLGIAEDKAYKLVERVEEKHGYMGSEIKTLAMKQGYDGIFEYFNNVLTEIVIWNSSQAKAIQPSDMMTK